MNRYDNYNPEIIYTESELPSEARDNSKDSVDETGKKQSRRNRPDSKTKKNTQRKKNVNAPAVFWTEKVKAWANGTNVRLLTGVFLACLAVYFTISFISYLSTCVEDASAIGNTAIGMAKNIHNNGGEGGARLSKFLINDTFGLGSVVIIFWLYAMALKLLTCKPHFKSVDFTIKCAVALIALSLVIGLVTISANTSVNWGGYHGRYVNEFIIHFLGWTGAFILCVFVIAMFVIICLRDLVNWIRRLYNERMERIREQERIREEQRKKEELIEEMQTAERNDSVRAGESEAPEETETDETDNVSMINIEAEDYNPEEAENETYVYKEDNEPSGSEYVLEDTETGADEKETDDREKGLSMVVNVNSIEQSDKVDRGESGKYPWDKPYKFPPTDILRAGESKISVDRTEQLENKEKIRKTLLDFGIPIVSIEATVGPTVTLYEIVPDKGVKIAKIRNLVDDIALSLSAIGVRIIAPIPGKGTVGIEVANKDPQTVSMRTIIQSKKYQESRYKLPVALGSTINNEVYITDLAKMPHLLVAGATGQGKSVGLNAIIASLLYKKKPDELKFVMIDPKMVEFSLYAKIEKHYLAKLPDETDPIITDMSHVVATLSSLCVEMDNRYQLLKAAHARNLEEYNEKIKNKKLNPEEGHRFFPYIVVIVDEFSDLIMTSGKEVEMPIARLAQKARAVGMHVIIATQRPSTNVITGIIKANFPARIAFKVTSGVDSKTILDTTGAQQLIGRGDMLISNNSEMIRVQCAFIDTPEVEEICDYISRQPYGAGAYILPEPILTGGDEGYDSEPGNSFGDRDPLFDEIARSIINSSTASTSSLQRRYSIGYNRAGKIMDQLEAAGIVGPSHGGKPRSVLVDAMTLESILNSK